MRSILLFLICAAPALTSAADLGPSFLAEWSVLREEASEIQVSGGILRLRTQPGRIWAGNGARNVLLSKPRESEEPIQLSARVSLQNPTVKFEQAGLLAYVNDDQFVKLAVEHIDGESWVVSALETPKQRKVLSKVRISGPAADLALELHGEVVLCRFRDAANAGSGWKFASSAVLPETEICRPGFFTQDGPEDRVNWARFADFRLESAFLIDPEFGVKKAATGCKFTEGPAISPGGELYFSDGPNNRIVKLDRAGQMSDFLSPSHAANGLGFDAEGRLVMCQGLREEGRAVARMALTDAQPTTLTREFDGKRYIAPNDLTIDKRGRIYFTDPFYSGEKSQPVSGVYRLDPDGTVERLREDLLKPNGILLTPDAGTLYVSDRGTQKLHRYAVSDDGQLTPKGILYDFSPDRGIDGMWIDALGNVYGAAGKDATTGLFVISPHGHLLLHLPMPEFSTNVVIGGEDGRDLFLTTRTTVYHMRTRFPAPAPIFAKR